MFDEKKEEPLNEEAEQYFLRRRVRETRKFEKRFAIAFIGIAVVFSAFSIGSYVVRDGKSPSQLQDSGAINRTITKSLEVWAGSQSDITMVGMMAGFGLGAAIFWALGLQKKDIEMIEKLSKDSLLKK